MKVVAAASLLAALAVVAPFLGQERSREKSDKDLLVVKPSEIKWEKADGMPEGVWVSLGSHGSSFEEGHRHSSDVTARVSQGQ